MSINGFELSATQKRMWQEQEQNNCLPGNTACVEITGLLDVEHLHELLCRIMDRHEIFRTSFVRGNAQLAYPLQVVSEHAEYPCINSFDVSDLDNDVQERYVKEVFSNMSANRKAATGVNCMLVKLSENSHVFVINLPALQADAITTLNVLHELFDDYNKEKADKDDPYQFIQFSEWHNELLATEETEAVTAWEIRKAQGGNSDVLSAVNTTDSGILYASLDKATSDSVQEHCRRKGYTTDHFLLAAWSLLVWSRHDKPQRFVLGREVKGRSLENFENINGPFAATLPVLVRPGADEPFSNFIREIKKECASVEELQDMYGHDGEKPGHQFQYINTASRKLNASGLEINLAAFRAHNNYFSSRLVCVDDGSRLSVDIQLNAGQYEAVALDCTLHQFSNLLHEIIRDDNTVVSSLFKASAFEQDLVQGFNNTAANFDDAVSVTERIAALAAVQADNTALKCGDETLNWHSFNAGANSLANYLIAEYGAGKGDIIAVKQERSVLLMVTILGILKTGAAYLPLDNSIPAERLQYILDDSNAKLLITSGETKTTAAVIVNSINDPIFNHDTAATSIERSANDIFYVMYTSGSTGKPKGVLVTDRCILNYTKWCVNACGLTNEDSSVIFSSLAFDLSYTALWPVLYSGGTLHLLEESTVFDPDHLLNVLTYEPITFIKLTPSHFNLLINGNAFESQAAQLQLRWIVSGGEHIRPSDIERFFAARNDIQFLNHYGPTETTIGVVTQPFDHKTFAAFSSRPVIGSPISNTQVYISDEQLNMLPLGALGEICVAGKGVAAGYLNREELTHEKFVVNPFGEGKLYKTGDLGRWLPNGKITLSGRKDFQVKINGYRIEPGEIERTMLNYESITKAYVTSNAAGNELAAFFTAEQAVNIAKLRQFLAKHLPSYMIPASIIAVVQIPLLLNGKTDRAALLKSLNMSLPEHDQQDYTPAETELEKQLSLLWQQALDTDRISIHDNFFDIGGNSFKLIRVFREFSKTWPGQLKLTDLFKYSTIHSLAAFLDEGQAQEAGVENTYGFEV